MHSVVHRDYLDQAIAFKRDQQSHLDGRPRGRRRSTADERELEREKRQREASFSVYFNGANDDKGNSAHRRHSAVRREAPPLSVQPSASVPSESDSRRRGWRTHSQEITGKITEQRTHSSSVPAPAAPLRSDDEGKSDAVASPAPSASPPELSPSSSPTSFLIGQSPSPAGGDGRRRRRTWGRGAIDVKTDDGATVHIQPRRIDWDPHDHNNRLSPHAEPIASPAQEKKEDVDALKTDSAQDTGEDTSAEVSRVGGDAWEDDEEKAHSLVRSRSPSSSSSRPPSISPPVAFAAPASLDERIDSSASDSPAPSPIPSSLLSSRRARVSLLPPADVPPPLSAPFASIPFAAVFPPAAKDAAAASARSPAPFGRRATAPIEAVTPIGSADERSPAVRASTAWIISPSEEKDPGGEAVQPQRAAVVGRRAVRSRALSTSAKETTLPQASATTAASTFNHPSTALSTHRRDRPSAATPTAEPSSTKARGREAIPLGQPSAPPPLASPITRRSFTHSLEELERSFDSLEQFHADLLGSSPSTTLRDDHQAGPTPSPRPDAAKTELEQGEDEDVDLLIDEFLSTTAPLAKPSLSIPAVPRRESPVHPTTPVLPLLPAGHVLTFRVLSAYGAASHASLARVELFDERGQPIAVPSARASVSTPHASLSSPAAPFPPFPRESAGWSTAVRPSSKPSAEASFSVAFDRATTLSLISVRNGPSLRGGRDDGLAKGTVSGVRRMEIRLDERVIFVGDLTRSTARDELVLFTRDEAVIAAIARSQRSQTERAERERLMRATTDSAAADRPSTTPPFPSPRDAAERPSGRTLQLLALPVTAVGRAAVHLPSFRVFGISRDPLLTHPPTVFPLPHGAAASHAAAVSLNLPAASIITRIEWDQATTQGEVLPEVLQVLLDGRLLWLGAWGGSAEDCHGAALEMHWPRDGSMFWRQPPAVRLWRDGMEVRGASF